MNPRYLPTTFVLVTPSTDLDEDELDPEDQGIAKPYLVEVTGVPADATSLEIQEVALDHFHAKIAIATLDDFTIKARILAPDETATSDHDLVVAFRRRDEEAAE